MADYKMRTRKLQVAKEEKTRPGPKSKPKLNAKYTEYCEEDIRRLIKAVEKEECLWNSVHKDQHRREKTTAQWFSIEKSLSFVRSNGRKNGGETKKLWKQLADVFKVEFKKIYKAPSGSATPSQSSFPFYKDLQFLERNLSKRAVNNTFVSTYPAVLGSPVESDSSESVSSYPQLLKSSPKCSSIDVNRSPTPTMKRSYTNSPASNLSPRPMSSNSSIRTISPKKCRLSTIAKSSSGSSKKSKVSNKSTSSKSTSSCSMDMSKPAKPKRSTVGVFDIIRDMNNKQQKMFEQLISVGEPSRDSAIDDISKVILEVHDKLEFLERMEFKNEILTHLFKLKDKYLKK